MISVAELNSNGSLISVRNLIEMSDLVCFDRQKLATRLEALGIVPSSSHWFEQLQPIDEVVAEMNADLIETAMLEIEQAVCAFTLRHPEWLDLDLGRQQRLVSKLCATLSQGQFYSLLKVDPQSDPLNVLCIPRVMQSEIVISGWTQGQDDPGLLDTRSIGVIPRDVHIEMICDTAEETFEAIETGVRPKRGFFAQIIEKYKEVRRERSEVDGTGSGGQS